MAENQDGEAVIEEKETFQYAVSIEEAGPSTKRVSVEIPADRIASKLDEQFKELRHEAAIPGFRPGHAPRKLIEKRFNEDVRDQVRRALVSESYEQAVESNKLDVIGEPEFDKADEIKLPGSGSLKYSFLVEVQPVIALPDMAGLKVKKPKVEVGEEDVDRALKNLSEQQGTLVPVEDRGAAEGDYLTADVHVKHEGNVVAHQHDAAIVARPARLGGIMIEDLAAKVSGMKAGETRTIEAKAPESHGNEAIRGKDVQIEVSLKDIKKLEPREINDEFISELGMDSVEELRKEMREQLLLRIAEDAKQAMRTQLSNFLLDNIQMELPEKLSAQQADRVVNRRGMDLLMRGVAREQVEANIEALRGGAKEEANRELKLFFILQKIAKEQGIEVDESELNGQIAMLAAQRGRRPEKMKQEMAKDGTLANLFLKLQEQKAVDKLLESATIEEVDLKQLQTEQAAAAEKPAGEAPAAG